MFTIGCHLSVSNGLTAAAKEALSLGGNTFQYFSRNPRGSKAKALDLADIENFIKICGENGIKSVVAHAPYTMNACSADAGLRDLAYNMMKEDVERLELIKGEGAPEMLYNFHPGSHVGQGMDVGIGMITETLNKILDGTQNCWILLESMSGKGSEVGSRFSELKQIIDGVENSEHLGVCLDSCHIYDGGYDIVGNLDGVLDEFDSIIGIEKLKAMHLNDSMNPFSSHKDRHQKIGEGSLGTEAISRIINHEKLKNLPFLLETPNENEGYKKEIALLKSLYKD